MHNIEFNLRFGEYRVWIGKTLRLRTGSKIEAIESVQNFGGHITWHFNDEILSCYDWQKIVTEDIADLYHRRAQQIRDQYNKVVIMYSGGFDSHNILMSFLENGIKIDAICFFYNSLSQGPDDYIMVEWHAQTWPKLQRLQQLYPWLEVVRMDTSYSTMSLFDKHWDDWLYLGKGMINPSTIGLSHLHTLLPSHLQSDNTCLLFGVDKPRVRFVNNEFRFFFLDTCFRPPVCPDSGIEYFYWSPNLPELLIKQAQITKQFWLQHSDLIATHKKNKANPKLGVLLDHQYDPLQRRIYPYCKDGTYLSWQPKDKLLLERDQWLVNSNTEYAIKIQSLVDSYVSKIRPEWFNQRDPRRGLVSYLAGDYLL